MSANLSEVLCTLHRGIAARGKEGSKCSHYWQAAEAEYRKAAQVCCRLLPKGLCRKAMPVQCTDGIGKEHIATLNVDFYKQLQLSDDA